MKKVYSADNLVMAGYIKNLLESCEIDCIIKNQNLGGAIGEIPPIECWPEVWIIEDENLSEATEIINSAMQENRQTNKQWKCECGETLEGQFSACWHCGAERSA
jgi:hypothetical protein